MIAMDSFCLWILILFVSTIMVDSFVPRVGRTPVAPWSSSSVLEIGDFFSGFGGGSQTASIPSTNDVRDRAAIESCKNAISNPKNPACPLIELEFPALASLNKLGDGSLRSTKEAEDANLSFVVKLANGLSSPLSLISGLQSPTVVVSASASQSFQAKVASKLGSSFSVVSVSSSSLSETVGSNGVAIFITPASKTDYTTAQELARSGSVKAVVLVNAFAKDQKSVPGDATMAYFLKPLTYNSQVAGFLIRSYPSDWTVLDAFSKQVLGSFSDDAILVPRTNTPDLRSSGKLVQKAVDERAIAARTKLR